MNDTALVVVGVLIGLMLGVSGIDTFFNIATQGISTIGEQFTQFSGMSTLALLVVAIILIAAVRIFSSLVVGVIAGAVLNIILKANNINIIKEIGLNQTQILNEITSILKSLLG